MQPLSDRNISTSFIQCQQVADICALVVSTLTEWTSGAHLVQRTASVSQMSFVSMRNTLSRGGSCSAGMSTSPVTPHESLEMQVDKKLPRTRASLAILGCG